MIDQILQVMLVQDDLVGSLGFFSDSFTDMDFSRQSYNRYPDVIINQSLDSGVDVTGITSSQTAHDDQHFLRCMLWKVLHGHQTHLQRILKGSFSQTLGNIQLLESIQQYFE